MTFEARYYGPCAADCGERIAPGDLVAYVDDELAHADCTGYGARASRRDEPPPCPRCWMVHRRECP